MCTTWHDVGLALSITEGKLKEIKANNPNDVGTCCKQMFSHWLQKDIHASWEKLMTALESPGIEYNSLAESIRCELTPGMLRMYSEEITYLLLKYLHVFNKHGF